MQHAADPGSRRNSAPRLSDLCHILSSHRGFLRTLSGASRGGVILIVSVGVLGAPRTASVSQNFLGKMRARGKTERSTSKQSRDYHIRRGRGGILMTEKASFLSIFLFFGYYAYRRRHI